MTLDDLFTLGFDRSTQHGKMLSARCSQCEALVINGTPCHETGCQNAARAKRDQSRLDWEADEQDRIDWEDQQSRL